MLDKTVSILCGGDVSFDLEIRQPSFIGAWRLKSNSSQQKQQSHNRFVRKIKRIWDAVKITPKTKIEKEFVELLIKAPANRDKMDSHWYSSSRSPINVDTDNSFDKFKYPFNKISSFLQSKDLVIVNLENPLSLNPRPHGLLISEPGFAKAMSDAGIDLVNLANNHIFDAGEKGFLETISHLKSAGVSYVGAGENIEKAREGNKIRLKGTTFTFLGYTQHCNHKYASVAGNNYAGILPLDRQLIVEDIQKARAQADFVFPILHWGIINDWRIHPTAIEIAHLLIDSGADGIIGHGPHVPQAIEVYRNKPIIYSTGNFIFGRNSKQWTDNYLVELIIDNNRIKEVIIHPISAQADEIYNPKILEGTRALNVLRDLNSKCEVFGNRISVVNFTGYIKIE